MARTLIIGATSAIAQQIARQLAARKDRLFLLGRSRDKLEPLVRDLEGAVAGHEVGDFTDTDSAATRVEQALDALGGLDLAIVAHGLLGDQLCTEQDFMEAKRVLDTNFSSVVAFLIPLANHFERQRSGRIAVISSVAADRGRPRNYTYGAAKGALNVYLQGLRSRLYAAGVTIHTIKLGPTVTPMTVDHPKNALFAHPEPVAVEILQAIERGVAEAYVPWFWRPIMGVVRNLPEPLFQRFKFLAGR